MATTYTSTIKLECWKVHRCVKCGSVFRYQFKRSVTGTSHNKDKASVNAQKAAEKMLKEGVDPRPCPTCGLMQPDMVGAGRATRHGWVTSLAFIVFATLLILAATDVIGLQVMGWAGAATAMVALLGHVAIASRDANRDLDANLRRAREHVERGVMQVIPGSRHGAAFGGEPDMRVGPPRGAAVLLMIVAVAALGLGEGVRTIRGWPLNAECFPPVVGPGDQTCVYFPPAIHCVAGHWTGRNAGAEAGIPIVAESRSDMWASTIRTKEKSSSETPWMNIRLGNDARAAGTTQHVSLRMNLSYPRLSGSNQYVDVDERVSRAIDLHVASAGAGSTYRSLSWFGAGGGDVAMLVGGILLIGAARRMRRDANPNVTLPIEQGPTAEALGEWLQQNAHFLKKSEI